ncbi:MAG: hypothetical protein JRH04_03215 [Deltaproteobacteria bacterium]|nr:hypothetical protein [Deltaproteobacteria bacterium]
MSLQNEKEIKKTEMISTNSQRQIDITEKENQRMRDQNEILNQQIYKLKEQIRQIKNENKNDMAIVRHQYKLMNQQIDKLKEENQKIKDENEPHMARMRDQNKILNQQINKLREENQRIRGENKTEIAGLKDQNEILNQQINKLKEEKQKIRHRNQALSKSKITIKVRSGDGNLDSANEMAKRLKNMGYKIQLIDYAPQSDFERNTVYFSLKFENEAKGLVAGLGDNTILKPLNCPSAYDLIVVTGKIH